MPDLLLNVDIGSSSSKAALTDAAGRSPPRASRADKGRGILTLAAVACPCHLRILLALVGGTRIAPLVAANFLSIFVVLGVLFGGALILGPRTIDGRSQRGCALPASRSRGE